MDNERMLTGWEQGQVTLSGLYEPIKVARPSLVLCCLDSERMVYEKLTLCSCY